MADGYNDWRNFRTLQLSAEQQSTLDYIVESVVYEPLNPEESNMTGYSTLRKCRRDAARVAEMAADIGVCSSRGGEEERRRRELQKTHLDAFSRRHQARKIFLHQTAARNWADRRESLLQGSRPHQGQSAQLAAMDQRLMLELSRISDQVVYDENRRRDYSAACWVAEDPSLNKVLGWLRERW